MLTDLESPLLPITTAPETEASLWSALGTVVQLAIVHEEASQDRLHAFMERCIAALKASQLQLLLDDQRRPWAFANWVLVNQKQHELWLAGDRHVTDRWQTPNDSLAGSFLWFVDFIAPFGNQLQALHHLKNLLPQHESAWTFSLHSRLVETDETSPTTPRQLW